MIIKENGVEIELTLEEYILMKQVERERKELEQQINAESLN